MNYLSGSKEKTLRKEWRRRQQKQDNGEKTGRVGDVLQNLHITCISRQGDQTQLHVATGKQKGYKSKSQPEQVRSEKHRGGIEEHIKQCQRFIRPVKMFSSG